MSESKGAGGVWDERFGREEYVYGKEPNGFLRSVAERIQAKGRVLCLAEGEGRNAVFLAGRGHETTALDASAVGLRKTRALAKEAGVVVETIHADLSTYDFEPEAWDGIVCIFGHLPPPVRKRVHGRIANALRPGGVFIMEAYTPAQLAFKTGGPPTVEMLYTADMLREELSQLAFEVLEETERDVVEGLFHTGRAAVVQVVARKT